MFRRTKYNPIDMIKNFWPEANTDHISFDNNLKARDYWIIRQGGGDGTALFTQEVLQAALLPIVNMTSYSLVKPPADWDSLKKIKYTIGPLKHSTVFGTVNSRTGQRDRVRLAVKCEYVCV